MTEGGRCSVTIAQASTVTRTRIFLSHVSLTALGTSHLTTIDVLFYFIETAPVNYTTERILYEKFLFSSHYDAVMEAAPPPPPPCFRPRPGPVRYGGKVHFSRLRTEKNNFTLENTEFHLNKIYFVFMVVPENRMKKQA